MPSFGTLKADTLTHSTAGSVTTDNVVEGVGKVRSNFDGTTSGITPRDSFNVSSIGDTNTGTYTINHTTAFSNNDYT